MKILLASDAWPPQVNGVVRTMLTVMHEELDIVTTPAGDLVVLTTSPFASIPFPLALATTPSVYSLASFWA